MQYFIADLHVGHKNLATKNDSRFTHGWREFDSVEEHDETIINAINQVVSPQDELYIIGDITLGSVTKPSLDYVLNILNKIKCKRIYGLIGNHEKGIMKEFKKKYNQQSYHPVLDRFADLDYIISKDFRLSDNTRQRIVMCHYPFASWPSAHNGAWHIHGHVHNPNYRLPGKILNVSIESIKHMTGKYNPVSLDWLAKVMSIQSIEIDENDSHFDMEGVD